MPSRDLKDLHPDLRPKAEVFLQRCKREITTAEIRIICTYRSNDEQAKEYAKGRSVYGVGCRCGGVINPKGRCVKHPLGLTVTRAKPGQSQHNFTLNGSPAARAFDYGVFINGAYEGRGSHPAWKQAGAIAKDLGLNWFGAPGSEFYELAHVQLR